MDAHVHVDADVHSRRTGEGADVIKGRHVHADTDNVPDVGITSDIRVG